MLAKQNILRFGFGWKAEKQELDAFAKLGRVRRNGDTVLGQSLQGLLAQIAHYQWNASPRQILRHSETHSTKSNESHGLLVHSPPPKVPVRTQGDAILCPQTLNGCTGVPGATR